jgi:hypothetical protein
MGQLGSERVKDGFWRVLEQSGRVENFPNLSEHPVRSSKLVGGGINWVMTLAGNPL